MRKKSRFLLGLLMLLFIFQSVYLFSNADTPTNDTHNETTLDGGRKVSEDTHYYNTATSGLIHYKEVATADKIGTDKTTAPGISVMKDFDYNPTTGEKSDVTYTLVTKSNDNITGLGNIQSIVVPKDEANKTAKELLLYLIPLVLASGKAINLESFKNWIKG